MSNVKYSFIIDGEEWKKSKLEQIEYQRNLHVLHQMKGLGVEIKDGGKILSHDDIDYLTQKKAWEISINTRAQYSGKKIIELYKESLKKSDEMWRKFGFSQDKPMKVSRCHMSVSGISLQEYMQMMQNMQTDEMIGLSAHPEHFITIVTNEKIYGIEPFGMYGTPTLCEVIITDVSNLGEQIRNDKKLDYPISMAGRAFLTDGVTEINSPFHQFKPTEDGFEVETAVYWPEKVPDEIVKGHSLHLACEFYEGLKLTILNS